MMNNKKVDRFSGVLAPVLTPFNPDMQINNDLFLKHCKFLASEGLGLAVFGTTSEGNSISVEEKIELLHKLIEAKIDPAILMPGTGCSALSDTIRLTKFSLDIGCAGVLMLPPFYYKEVTIEGLYNYYSEVIQQIGSSNLRIYLYHIPPVAQVPITIQLIEKLIKNYPNIVVGIKDSSGDWANTKAMLDCQWDDFRIFVGSENYLLQNMEHGGSGCISATANINPRGIKELCDNWDKENSHELQKYLTQIRNSFSNFPLIPALKSYLAGYLKEKIWLLPRPPLTPLSKTDTTLLAENLGNINFKFSN